MDKYRCLDIGQHPSQPAINTELIYLSAKLDCYQNCQYKCLHAAVYLYCNIYRVIKTDCGKSRIHSFVNDDWIQLGYWIRSDFLLVSNFPLFESSYRNVETSSSTSFNQLQLSMSTWFVNTNKIYEHNRYCWQNLKEKGLTENIKEFCWHRWGSLLPGL